MTPKPREPSSVMSTELRRMLADPDHADTIRKLMDLIVSAPDAMARRERTIAIQGFAQILLEKETKKN